MLSQHIIPTRCSYPAAHGVVGWEGKALYAVRPWPISALSLAHGDGEGPR